jgi:prepilin-type N-terminal cleavage/methylation domain-containing protein
VLRHNTFVRGFTLIELIVTVAILAVLVAIVIVAINPVDLLRQTRDIKRIGALNALNAALPIAQFRGLSLGSANTVYVSVADPAATSTAGTDCSSLGLPGLPPGYSYHCPATSTVQKVDGTGWVPINFASYTTDVPFSALPIDPINTSSSGNYLSYVMTGGNWAMASMLESSRYGPGGDNDKTSTDGGSDDLRYEMGTNLSLWKSANGLIAWWKLDEGAGVSTADSSGNGNTGTLINGATWGTGKVGPYAVLTSAGSNQYVGVPNIAQLNGASRATIVGWMKRSVANGDVFVGEYGGGAGGFDFDADTDGNLYFELFNGGSGVQPTVALNDTNWHHIALVYDGTQSGNAARMKGYVDGVQQTLTFGGTVPATIPILAVQFQMGNYSTRTTSAGMADAVRVYSRALSTAEILRIYQAVQ